MIVHMEENTHTKRLLVALLGVVALLVVAAWNQLAGTDVVEQQATVLRVYAE